MSNNKVYYGEFSLKHWTQLMLTGDIVLPEYQRDFKWNKDAARTFLESLRDGIFVPPVTIGSFQKDGKVSNYILDGQQRLSSILLATLGFFVNRNKITKGVTYINENDYKDDKEDTNAKGEKIHQWQFSMILEKANSSSIEVIKEKIGEDKDLYLPWEEAFFDADFFKNTYLGFSFIVPDGDAKYANKCFAKTFRNINNQGEPLHAIESRKALYFLDNSLATLFDPEICKKLSPKAPIDFTRYLALVSQYCSLDGAKGKVAYKYANYMELYYEIYIDAVVNGDKTTMFGEYPCKIQEEYKERIENLKYEKYVDLLKHDYRSIIDADMFFFGLVYWVIFQGKEIDMSKTELLRKALLQRIDTYKEDSKHSEHPAQLQHINTRLKGSLDIYKKYCIE